MSLENSPLRFGGESACTCSGKSGSVRNRRTRFQRSLVERSAHAACVAGGTECSTCFFRTSGDIGLLASALGDHLGFLVSHNWLLSSAFCGFCAFPKYPFSGNVLFQAILPGTFPENQNGRFHILNLFSFTLFRLVPFQAKGKGMKLAQQFRSQTDLRVT